MSIFLDSLSLGRYLERMLENHIPDGFNKGFPSCDAIKFSLDKLNLSFKHINKKYYTSSAKSQLDYLNSDHMVMLLYFLSRYYAEVESNTVLAKKFFYLNKIMHGLDLFYSIEMPKVFMVVHPVGTVIGRATFRDFLAIYQNVTIGSDTNIYPKFGEGIVLYAGAKVIGDCQVGSNVIFGANSFIINCNVPSDSLVVGQFPNHKILPNKRSVRSYFFGIDSDWINS